VQWESCNNKPQLTINHNKNIPPHIYICIWGGGIMNFLEYNFTRWGKYMTLAAKAVKNNDPEGYRRWATKGLVKEDRIYNKGDLKNLPASKRLAAYRQHDKDLNAVEKANNVFQAHPNPKRFNNFEITPHPSYNP